MVARMYPGSLTSTKKLSYYLACMMNGYSWLKGKRITYWWLIPIERALSFGERLII